MIAKNLKTTCVFHQSMASDEILQIDQITYLGCLIILHQAFPNNALLSSPNEVHLKGWSKCHIAWIKIELGGMCSSALISSILSNTIIFCIDWIGKSQNPLEMSFLNKSLK